MPSATTKIPRSGTMRKLSSFPDRMMPTSVRPAAVMCTGVMTEATGGPGRRAPRTRSPGPPRWRRIPSPSSAAAAAPPGPGAWARASRPEGALWVGLARGPSVRRPPGAWAAPGLPETATAAWRRGRGGGLGGGGGGLGGGWGGGLGGGGPGGPGRTGGGGGGRRPVGGGGGGGAAGGGRPVGRHRMGRAEHLGAAAFHRGDGIVGRLENELHVSQPDHCSRCERRVALHPLPIHEGAVGGIEVHEHPYALAPLQLRVTGRHRRIGDHDVVVVRPSDVDDGRSDGEPLSCQRAHPHQEGGEGRRGSGTCGRRWR